MKIFSQYRRPLAYKEVHLDEGKVERAGYVPTSIMVARLIDAGQRLIAFREAEFPADTAVPDDYEPLPVMGNLDALRLDRQVKARLLEQRDEGRRKAAAAAAKPLQAPEAPAVVPQVETK